jgi:hypothetical protein
VQPGAPIPTPSSHDAQHTTSLAQPPSSPFSPNPSGGAALTSPTPKNAQFEKALADISGKLPETEKVVFAQASKTIDEHSLLSGIHKYDADHSNNSSYRPHAERLSKVLGLLNTVMGGVVIGLAANPEISALLVGSFRVVVDLALKFTTYFSRLTDMICTFQDYLGPLAEYAKAADKTLVETMVVKAYANVIEFGWKARRVFVDANGNPKKWTSVRAFLRQQWEPFENEFASIKEDLQHHLDVMLHSVVALQFDLTRKAEKARRLEEQSKAFLL